MKNELAKGITKLTPSFQELTPDIALLRLALVNACLVGDKNGWILVDAGPETSAGFIVNSSLQRFGKDHPPGAIFLTHGHSDHAGSALQLAELWDVAVYAHELEIPYITGKKSYPLATSDSAEKLAAKTTNLGYRVAALPPDGSLPGINGWRWLHTPGHTEGHVCFYRDLDRALIAGDAFTTARQPSLWPALPQDGNSKNPPAYLVTDWAAAGRSMGKIRALKPDLAIPGHGAPMKGDKLARYLEMLFLHFEGISVPEHAQYGSSFTNH